MYMEARAQEGHSMQDTSVLEAQRAAMSRHYGSSLAAKSILRLVSSSECCFLSNTSKAGDGPIETICSTAGITDLAIKLLPRFQGLLLGSPRRPPVSPSENCAISRPLSTDDQVKAHEDPCVQHGHMWSPRPCLRALNFDAIHCRWSRRASIVVKWVGTHL